jgi:hypothetical protein
MNVTGKKLRYRGNREKAKKSDKEKTKIYGEEKEAN